MLESHAAQENLHFGALMSSSDVIVAVSDVCAGKSNVRRNDTL